MLDEDELEAEVAMFRAPEPRVAPKKRLAFADYANEGADDLPAPPQRPILKRTNAQMIQRKSSFLIEEDDDDDLPTVAVPRREQVKVGAPVSYRQQEAASLLIGDRRLSKPSIQELTMAYLHKPHEFITLDPLILVCASVETGTARIYCKEVVNVSLHWMALALDATFFVQVTPKARTPEEPWTEAITARPCRSAQTSERVQRVDVLACVQRALAKLGDSIPSDLDQQVEQYMTQVVGVMDSATACDPEWARDHIDALRAICHGRGKALQTKPTSIHEKLAQIGQ
jgi:hypothetical protein